MAENVGRHEFRQYFYSKDGTDKPDTAYLGDRLYIIDDGVHEVWDGEDWVEYFQPRFLPEGEEVEE